MSAVVKRTELILRPATNKQPGNKLFGLFVSDNPGRLKPEHTLLGMNAMAEVLRGGTSKIQGMRAYLQRERGISLAHISEVFQQASHLLVRARVQPQLLESLTTVDQLMSVMRVTGGGIRRQM